MTLTEFLLARIADDEALAERSVQIGDKGAALISFGTPDAPRVLILHPERVLADCAAKRRLVELRRNADVPDHPSAFVRGQDDGFRGALDEAIAAFAAVYADHPDYQPEWRPDADY